MRIARSLQQTGFNLAGLVYLDKNRDNIPNCDEPGIPGVRIDFNDCSTGASLGPAYTDINGEIAFENLNNVPRFSYTIDVPDTFDVTGIFDTVKPETNPFLDGITITQQPETGITRINRTTCIENVNDAYVFELGIVPKSGDTTGVPGNCLAFGAGPAVSTSQPTLSPTRFPTLIPTSQPTLVPVSGPTNQPTLAPTSQPTLAPTLPPTGIPTFVPTLAPVAATNPPTLAPTPTGTLPPTFVPTLAPTFAATSTPISAPTFAPTFTPTPPTVGSSAPTSARDQLVSFLATNALTNTATFADPTTPQAQALAFLEASALFGIGAADEEARLLELYALSTLYFATDGANWFDNQNWLSTTVDYCSWFEVTCTDANLVQNLTLFANTLTGTLPSELRALGAVQAFELYENFLFGTLPTFLGELTTLRVLDFDVNDFSGVIPTNLGTLTELRSLVLSNNFLTTIDLNFAQLTNLESLWLSFNPIISPLPTELFTITTLKTLLLDDGEWTGPIPTEIANLVNLEEFDVFNNTLDGTMPSVFGSFPNLATLTLQGNFFTGTIPPEYGNLRNLVILDLGLNLITGVVPATLGIFDTTTQGNPLLDRFDVSFTTVGGALPVTLCNVPNLFTGDSNVDVSGCG